MPAHDGPARKTPEGGRVPRSFRSYILVSIVSLLAAASTVHAQSAAFVATLLDDQGRLVRDARIVVSTPIAVACTAVADHEGRATCDRLPDGDYTVHVSADGLRADPQPITVAAGTAPAITITLSLAALHDAIVVTAAAVETPRSASPAATTVITAGDVRVTQRDRVADALGAVPGMTITSNGGVGAVTSSFPRGGESDYTLLIVDGVRMNTFGGGLDLAHLSTAGVERIEVTRGPQSALYGADAIGGVVDVVSRASGPLTVTASGDAGSFDTRQSSASVSGTVGTIGVHASGDYADSQGWNDRRAPNGERVSNDDYTRRAISGGLTWTPSAVTFVRAHAQRRTSARGNPGPFGADPNGTFTGIDRIARGTMATTGVAAALTQRMGSRWHLRVDATHATLDSGFVSAFGASVMDTIRDSGRAQLDATFTRALSASAGVEVTGEDARSTYITDTNFDILPIERRVVGSFGELRLEAGRLFAAIGLRAEHITRSSLAGNADPYTPRPTFADDTVVSWNPKLAVSYMLVPMRDGRTAQTRIKLNAGTGIRPPDAFEIAFTDNPSLAPERSRSLDIGVEQLLASGRVAIEATYFANRYDDLIVAVGRSFADASRYRTDNVANARARGLELSASLRASGGVALRAGYTRLDSDVLAVDGHSVAPSPFEIGQSLLRRPAHQGFVEATILRTRFNAFARATARGEVLDVDPSWGAFGGTVTAPGFARVDAGAALRLPGWRGAEIFGRVTNLLDRDHEEALGFPALGRAFTGGLRLDFRR